MRLRNRQMAWNRHPERSEGSALVRLVVLVALIIAPCEAPAQRTPPPAVQRYFALTRPAFSGDRARNVVAFMDRYFRIPGNTGFNATLDTVAKILTAAGYVEQSKATAADRLTYR